MRHDTLTAAEREVYESGRWLEPPSDVARMLTLLSPLCPNTDTLLVTTIEGPPKSKARPRLGKGGRFYSPSTVDEDALAERLWVIMEDEPFEGNVVLVAVFFRQNYQRIDTDNMLKLVLDAGTKAGLWIDDCQVTAVLGVVELDAARPRTLIGIAEHETTLNRQRPHATCQRCGRVFPIDHWGRKQALCSRDCKGDAVRQEKSRPGQGRGPKHQPAATCIDCGRELTKRSFIRCRDCWKTARKAGIS
jgi:Holliday junction resolvase RusA-like endonuclease